MVGIGHSRRDHAHVCSLKCSGVAPPWVEKTFKALEKAMTKAENAETAFRQALARADVSKQSLSRATSRIINMGGLTRVRGRKAVGIER